MIISTQSDSRVNVIEELFVRYKNTFEWEKVSFNVAYPGIKKRLQNKSQ
jgi:hypothetical protein